jgi:regulatory protein YycH of two-component signal transduction system YycFG
VADDDEFQKFMLPPAPLSLKRKLVIHATMIAITLLTAWLFNDPSSPLFIGAFQ